jgi:glutamyl-tRNA synthetase
MNKETLKKIILENAVKHKGKANTKFVYGTVIKEYPEYKKDINKLKEILEPVVQEINKLSHDEQKEILAKINPEFFEEKERDIFGFLNIDENTKVITAFPPSPEKHYHIGHAKAILLNYLLSKKHNGQFYLRFEDTNPKNVRPEYYKVMLNDISWLGVEWDKLIYASDHIDLLYDHATKLVQKGRAYVCFCKTEDVRKARQEQQACDCSKSSIDENLKNWLNFKNYEEGEATLRLKIDMKHKNTRMRDPTIFRIIDAEHPRHGYAHRAYPTYDFQNAVLDGYFNITHRFRTQEFEMASELHHYIRKILKLYDTFTYEIARFNLKGMLSSGRIIREKIKEGELMGWDDPSLPTLAALRRRGFTPEAIKQLVVESGISKSSGTALTWDTLEKYNKRILNDKSERYFFIEDPVEIEVENDPKKEYFLKKHPNIDLGKRKFKSVGKYYVDKKDFEDFKDNDLIRLMDNINIIKKENKFIYKSEDYLDYKNHKDSKKIIHFLPKDENQIITIKILMPDHRIIESICEKNISSVKEKDVIQFERFGFCRLDSIVDNKYTFWFTHK